MKHQYVFIEKAPLELRLIAYIHKNIQKEKRENIYKKLQEENKNGTITIMDVNKVFHREKPSKINHKVRIFA